MQRWPIWVQDVPSSGVAAGHVAGASTAIGAGGLPIGRFRSGTGGFMGGGGGLPGGGPLLREHATEALTASVTTKAARSDRVRMGRDDTREPREKFNRRTARCVR